jgi:hypothetical protein
MTLIEVSEGAGRSRIEATVRIPSNSFSFWIRDPASISLGGLTL